MKTALQVSHIRSIHPFPARMAPSVVWDCLPNDERVLTVMDPMAGSGTTLVSARAKGHKAIGFDTDPLALLIARAWCHNVNVGALRHRSQLVLDRARRLAESLSESESYPEGADVETREFVRYWFHRNSRIQLSAISKCISRVRDPVEKTLLWCAFSRLIITKRKGVSLAVDVPHSRPRRVYERSPVLPFDRFLSAIDHIGKCAPFSTGCAPEAVVARGDARALPTEDGVIDVIVTSPPYLNAIDYIRGHRLSLVWMGHSVAALRSVRAANIGTEKSIVENCSDIVNSALECVGKVSRLDPRRRMMLLRYLRDMNSVMSECRRVLKPGGQAYFVIGDSTVRGVFIRNSEALIHLASANRLQLMSRTVRIIQSNRRYLPPPDSKASGGKMQKRMFEEAVLGLCAT